MSDGMMEGYRDQCRAEAETRFLSALADHVESPSDGTWHALRDAAEKTDSVRGGNFSGPTNWTRDIGSLVTGLIEREPKVWAKLLCGMLDASSYGLSHGTGQRLKALSPFAGKTLVVSYGDGASFGGETNAILKAAVAAGERTVAHGEHALVAVDLDAFAQAGTRGISKVSQAA